MSGQYPARETVGRDGDDAPERKRTVWIWIIVTYTAFTASFTVYLLVSDALSNGWRHLFDGNGRNFVWMLVQWSGLVLFVAGSWPLFQLRVRAVGIYLASLIFSGLSDGKDIYDAAIHGATAAGEETSTAAVLVISLLDLVIAVAVYFYAWRLRRKRLLI